MNINILFFNGKEFKDFRIEKSQKCICLVYCVRRYKADIFKVKIRIFKIRVFNRGQSIVIWQKRYFAMCIKPKFITGILLLF